MKPLYKLGIGVAILLLIGVGGWQSWRAQSRNDLVGLTPDTKLTDDQVSRVVARISQFMVVPSDEQPSAVVVKDAAQMADQQPLYKGARDGDILVVYSSKAIIYNPDSDKLVNVGPIVRNDAPSTASGSASSPTPPPTPTPAPITIDVLNGSGVVGLAGETANALKKNVLFTIGRVGDARAYHKATIVVGLTSDAAKSVSVAELAKQLNVAEVSTALPAGELATTADAVVIVGK